MKTVKDLLSQDEYYPEGLSLREIAKKLMIDENGAMRRIQKERFFGAPIFERYSEDDASVYYFVGRFKQDADHFMVASRDRVISCFKKELSRMSNVAGWARKASTFIFLPDERTK